MWRRNANVRPLTGADRQAALALCALDPVANTYVAARIAELGLDTRPPNALGVFPDRTELGALAWTNANIVPVNCDDAALLQLADRLQSERFRASSIFGSAAAVLPLYGYLGWHAAEIRDNQPLMVARDVPSEHGITPDPYVRLAEPDELDAIVPAAAAMFTEELGYPPYTGSDRWYRQCVLNLINRGHTFVYMERDRVVFKADIGSLAFGVAQVQGVWVAPEFRGKGLGKAGMAAVVEHTLRHIAPAVSLYVNDFNGPALGAYRAVGFRQEGRFATVLL